MKTLDLVEKGLAKRLTPDQPNYRYYKTTELGMNVLRGLKNGKANE